MKLRLSCIGLLVLPLVARAEVPEHPYPSVNYVYEKRETPQPQKIYVARIDLTDANVRVRVSRGGPDPDGEGKWETTLMRPTKVADREGFDVVINGDFFAHLSGKDAEGAAALKEFKSGIPATVTGPAMTDGKVWATPAKPPGVHGRSREASVDWHGYESASRAFEVIAGSDVLVKDGKNVAPPPTKPGFARGPHPRTAVGIGDNGKTLILVVIDGRKKGEAIGMSLTDEADVMLKYGANDAINLDGGGSSMLGIRDPKTGKMQIMNTPSDGAERSVGNVLGVSVEARACRVSAGELISCGRGDSRRTTIDPRSAARAAAAL